MGITARHALRYPELTDTPDGPAGMRNLATDTDGWLTRAFPCLSTARPATPATGQLIYETDTGVTAAWTGAGWVSISGSDEDATVATYEASAAQSFANNTEVTAAFGVAVTTDANVTRAADGAGHQFTLNTAGFWTLTATLRFVSAGAGERTFELTVGGTTTVAKAGGPGSGVPFTANLAVARRFGAGTVIRAVGFQNTGAAINSETAGGEWFHLDLARVTG